MKIVEVDHSLANRFDGYIEINKNLRKYPKLLKPILTHELEHTDDAFTWKDFKLDFFSDSKVNQWDLIKFMFKYPRSFKQLLPVLYSKKKGFVLDINLLIMYITMLSVFILVLILGVKYL